MSRFILNVTLGALAFAAPLFSASSAFASTTCKTSQGTVTIVDPTTCHFETAGGCTSQCVPVNFTTTCDESCTATAATTCTDTCQTKCATQCTTTPTTFKCKDYCSTDCEAGCSASCTGDQCMADCASSCDSQCTEKCSVHPGSTDCTTECQDSCSGSCTVQANITCNTMCTSALTGGCTTKCTQPSGALFCDNQYIDISTVTDCDFTITVTASGTAKATCSAAPGTNAPFGAASVLAVAGLGLFVARRRRSA